MTVSGTRDSRQKTVLPNRNRTSRRWLRLQNHSTNRTARSGSAARSASSILATIAELNPGRSTRDYHRNCYAASLPSAHRCVSRFTRIATQVCRARRRSSPTRDDWSGKPVNRLRHCTFASLRYCSISALIVATLAGEPHNCKSFFTSSALSNAARASAIFSMIAFANS